MVIPNDSISQINTYINIFKIKYRKPPTRAIVNEESLSLLRGNDMLMPNDSVTNEESYTNYVLNNECKIKFLPVYFLEKLLKKEKTELEEKVKNIKTPIILANKKKHYIFGDLSLCDKELVEFKEDIEKKNNNS